MDKKGVMERKNARKQRIHGKITDLNRLYGWQNKLMKALKEYERVSVNITCAMLVRFAREGMGMSASKLSKQLGVTRQALSLFETGVACLNKERRRRLEKILGIKLPVRLCFGDGVDDESDMVPTGLSFD
jgi:ribosome-binding protein aMBF1 (putative translation factor)